ncbi:MAG: hypothetical protein WC683_09535 [bacterium]
MTPDLQSWYDDLHYRREGETDAEHICRVVRELDGVSLHSHREKLDALFCSIESESRAKVVDTWETNCASSAWAIIWLLGGFADPDDLVLSLRVGEAMSKLRGKCAHALAPSRDWRDVTPGCMLCYWSSGNDAHIEWALSAPDAAGLALHGGGGRAGCAITCSKEPQDIRTSWGRRLQEIYLPEKLITREELRYLPGVWEP